MRKLIYISLIIWYIPALLFPQVKQPDFSLAEGFFNNSITLRLIPQNTQDIIYYTADGSEPTDSSIRYTTPFVISRTTVIRARSYISDSLYSSIKSNTYFINEQTELPVFSISTNPANLWDPKSGIYVNYMLNQEIPVHLEFFETGKKRVIEMDAGARIHGEGSRAFPQKSLVILARRIYGFGKINYKFFPDLSIDKFESILLHSGGSDWNGAMFRDPLVHSFVKDIDIDISAWRPCIVFLNGEYWGIHYIRERSDEHYLESHYGVHPDSVDISFYWGLQPSVGIPHSFMELKNFMQKDLSQQKNYDTVKSKMDIEEFINYTLTEIFFDNTDWPANNVKEWKPWGAETKWRWILYDTDVSLDHRLRESYKHPSLTYATSEMGRDWPNPPMSRICLVALLQNQEFKNNLISRFADLTNTLFKEEQLLKAFNTFVKDIESEVPRHFKRWNDSSATWYSHLNAISTFIKERHPYIRQDLINKFNLPGTAEVSLNVNSNSAGRIKINSIDPYSYPWKGIYFKGIPVTITAVPLPGYKFKGWEDPALPDSISISLQLDSDIFVNAFFEPDQDFNNVVINEINYNSAPGFDAEDWIELYNPGIEDINISGWIFKDSDDSHSYRFSENTLLRSNNYIVICRDTAKFSEFFPGITEKAGNFDFGLNNAGEQIRLFDNDNNIVDSLSYDDEIPWPTEADGTGKTLELKNPGLDNTDPSSWTVSSGNGTPAKQNDSFIIVSTDGSPAAPDFCLYQNYPNPFNPETYINYSIPKTGMVTLIVYNLLGEIIEVLVKEIKSPGKYTAIFNGESQPSGMYIFRLEAEGLSASGKMILLK